MKEAFGVDAESDVSVDRMTVPIIDALTNQMRLGEESEEEDEAESDEPIMDAIPDVQEQ